MTKVHTAKECLRSNNAREKGDHMCGLNQQTECPDMMQLKKNVMWNMIYLFFCHIDKLMKQGQGVWGHGMEHIGISVLLLTWWQMEMVYSK